MENIRDVNNMKCWVFRMAQKKWNIASPECSKIFADYHLFDCISEGYDYLHLMSYKSVVDELETILHSSTVSEVTDMTSDDKLREFGAVTLMQRMLEKYAAKYRISSDEALMRFANSPVYEALFDFDGTELWKEGPDYLLKLFEEAGK